MAGVKDGGSARETRRLGGMRRLGAPGGSHGFELLRRLHRGREVGDPDLREKLGKLLVAHRAKALSPGGDEPKSSRVTDLAEHPVVVVEHLVEVLPEGREPVRPSVGGRRPLLTGGGRRGDDDQRDHRRWNRECSRGFHGLCSSLPPARAVHAKTTARMAALRCLPHSRRGRSDAMVFDRKDRQAAEAIPRTRLSQTSSASPAFLFLLTRPQRRP